MFVAGHATGAPVIPTRHQAAAEEFLRALVTLQGKVLSAMDEVVEAAKGQTNASAAANSLSEALETYRTLTERVLHPQMLQSLPGDPWVEFINGAEADMSQWMTWNRQFHAGVWRDRTPDEIINVQTAKADCQRSFATTDEGYKKVPHEIFLAAAETLETSGGTPGTAAASTVTPPTALSIATLQILHNGPTSSPTPARDLVARATQVAQASRQLAMRS